MANLKQIIKDGDLRIHPLVTRLVVAETLEKMGVKKMGQSQVGEDQASGGER